MGILDDDVARVRESTDLVALAGEHIGLKRVGRRFMGLCPFHTEKTASFSVNPELGVYYCLAGETRVITWDGVREIRELADTTQRILTTNGRWIDAPFYSFGVQPLMKVTLSRNRVKKEIWATPEHRWLVSIKGHRRERRTNELRPGHGLCWTFTHRVLSGIERLSPFGIAHGITYGDGTLFYKGSAVDLHGTKDAELLKWFPLSHTHQCERTDRHGRRHGYLKVVDLPAYFKERPSLDESPNYLVGWLAGYFAADGCVAADGTVILNSANRDDLEFVRLLCTRVGIGTYGITSQMRTGLGDAPTALYRIHFINDDLDERFFLLSEHRDRFNARRKAFHRKGWNVKTVERTDRTEEVFCAVVPGEHAFALEDNILTGNCFGCQKSGDAITFIREVEHLDFVEAVERLAARAGITLRYDNVAVGKDRKRKERLSEVVGTAIAFYHRLLVEAPEGGPGRKHLRSRSFDGDAARRFQLGWAPDGFDALSVHLQRAGFERKDIVDAGLAFVNRANKLQDQFRSRLMFPIYDSRGEPAGFGGRALGDQMPKYKNSPETPIYQKSRLLYGLNWAKGEIVARGDVVICEGYTDVMAFALSGTPNAVATCGTALADEHFQILKNLARKVVLAYDADSAGQAAAERWYQWEQAYEVQVQVADLPPGRDPGDLWKEDPAALTAAIERAAPFLQFRIDRLLAGADLRTLESKARTAEDAAAIIAAHPSELVRDQYVMKLAGMLEIDADQLRAAVRAGPRRRPARESRRDGDIDTPPRPPPPTQVDRRELDVLRWAIHRPELVADWLDASLFVDPAARSLFELLAESATFQEALDTSDDSTRALLQRLANEEPPDVEDADELATLSARLMTNTVEPAAQRLLVAMLRDGDERGSEVKAHLSAMAHHREIGDWEGARRDAEQLVGWAVARDDSVKGAE
jgi:DNA primase